MLRLQDLKITQIEPCTASVQDFEAFSCYSGCMVLARNVDNLHRVWVNLQLVVGTTIDYITRKEILLGRTRSTQKCVSPSWLAEQLIHLNDLIALLVPNGALCGGVYEERELLHLGASLKRLPELLYAIRCFSYYEFLIVV